MNSRRLDWRAVGGSLFYLAPFVALTSIYWGTQADDALIYQRYLKNLMSGQGLVYNVGEYFNAMTSPLYVLVGAVASFIVGHVETAAIGISVLFSALALLLFQQIFHRKEDGPILAYSGALFAASSPYLYSVFGMETSLFLTLIAASIILFQREKIFWLGISCALLLITRGEGVFLIFALAIEHIRQRRAFPGWKNFVVPTLLVAAWLVFNWVYFGHPLPDTLSAKVGQGKSGLWGEWPIFLRQAHYLVDWYMWGSSWFLLSWLFFLVLGVVRLGRTDLNVISLVFLITYSYFYIALNIPQYHWYYAPIFVFGYFYAGLGYAWVFARIKRKHAGLAVLYALAGFVGFGVFNAMRSATQPLDFPGYAVYQHVGDWLNENSPAESKVASAEIGWLGFKSERYIIDILGLVSPYNAALIEQRNFTQWLEFYEPNYIVTHSPVWEHEQGALMVALVGNWTDPVGRRFDGINLMEREGEAAQFYPAMISTPATPQFYLSDENYALSLATPSQMEFLLPPGKYHLDAEFGPHLRTVGESVQSRIVFSAEPLGYPGRQENLFDQEFEALPTGLKEFDAAFEPLTFELEQSGRLLVRILPGEGQDAMPSRTWWRNLRITKIH